ncbi:MAG TPA: RICIN domain-containing protein, partial [Candidatus Methylacidiphilales bacterium]|nr:RICIN domain-containing protein [Candidatus Methylacidiphilales bacterium]
MTKIAHGLIILALSLCSFSFDSGLAQADPTAGFRQISDSYSVQYPSNVTQSQRFTAVNGVYTCWVYGTDSPDAQTSNTLQRTEMRWETWPNQSLMNQLAFDEMFSAETQNTCIHQIKSDNKGNGSGGEAIYMQVNTPGTLRQSVGKAFATGIAGTWFHINSEYNPATGVMNLYYNGSRVYNQTGFIWPNGNWYFKTGAYDNGMPTTAESWVQLKNVIHWVQTFAGTYELQNVSSGLALEVSGASTANGTAVVQYPYSNGSPNAEWNFTATSNGYYQITNVQSGLDAAVTNASTSAGALINQWSFGATGDDQWLPTQNSDGSYTFYNLNSGLVLDDPGSNSSPNTQMDQASASGGKNQEWNLVSLSPVITSVTNTTFTNGQAGSFTVTANGAPAPTFSATNLPSWASLNSSTGVISGTPSSTSGSPYSVHLTASNGISPNSTQTFILTVTNSTPPGFSNGPPTSTDTVGTIYSFSYETSGYPASTYSLTSGSLPPGLTLSSGGVICGVPIITGTYTGTVTASNGISPNASQNFTITISEPPFSGTYELQNATSGLALNVKGGSTSNGAEIVQYPFGNGQSNSQWTFAPTGNGYYQIISLKSGSDVAVVNASTSPGALIDQWSFGTTGDDQWEPVQNSNGTYTFYNLNSGLVLDDPGSSPSSNTQMDQATATGGTNQEWNIITVSPTITSTNTAAFTVGVPGSFTITATGTPAPTFSATGLPSWASLNTTTGII